MTNDKSTFDEFTPGEKLDMAIAHKYAVLVFSAGRRDDKFESTQITQTDPKEMVYSLKHMADVDGKTPEILTFMKEVVEGYEDLTSYKNRSEHIFEPTDDEIEDQVALISSMLRSKDNKSFGIVLIGEPTSYGVRVAAGIRGSHNQIVESIKNWVHDRPKESLVFLKDVETILNDAKPDLKNRSEFVRFMKMALTDKMRDMIDDKEGK